VSSSADTTLLVALEPATEAPAKTAGIAPMVGAAGAVLLAEGARLARELSVEARAVTWVPESDPGLDRLATTLADLAAEVRPLAVLLADTDLGRQLAPMVAHRLGSGVVLGCIDVLVGEVASRTGATARRAPGLSFVKPVYGGWLEQRIDPAAGTIPVATLDLTGLETSVVTGDGPAEPEVMAITAADGPGAGRVRRLALIPPDFRSVDLAHARRIVTAGAGSTGGVGQGGGAGLLSVVCELAELLEGCVGATRPVVDDGLLPKDRLIGQTGRTVEPELYVALGVSGSPHHVAGVRSAGRVVSINRDSRAPIFQFSDVGYVADLETVLPALVQKIKEWRDASGTTDEPR